MKDLIATLADAADKRATIERLIDETNNISGLSNAFQAFHIQVRSVRRNLKSTDEEILSHLNVVVEGKFNRQTANVVPVEVYRMMDSAKELMDVANTNDVAVDFSVLIGVDGYEVEDIPYWNTSSLSC